MTVLLTDEEYQELILYKQEQEATGLLCDFSGALEETIELCLEHFGQTVFINRNTGNKATSIFAAMVAIKWEVHRTVWPKLMSRCTDAGGLNVYPQWDLKAVPSIYPTVCIDLCAVERVFTAVAPYAAGQKIQEFKRELGIA